MNDVVCLKDSILADAKAPSASRRMWAALIGRVASLDDRETNVSTRGFVVERPEVIERLEAIGGHFAWGYNHAVRCASLPDLANKLAARPIDDCGFSYEGAAMGLAIADWMTPGRRFFESYVSGAANHHEYMAWVGLGWSIARLPVSAMRTLERHRSINRWLALDGYGFHEGYFNWRKSVIQCRRPRNLNGDASRIFDQGLGRSLWFVRGADPNAVTKAIASFGVERHADLWAGVGLAATYAGGAPAEALRALRDHAGRNLDSLAQGVVFAAEARRRARNAVPHSEMACLEVLGISLSAAADLAIAAMPVGDDSLAAYQSWRFAIQERCRALPRDSRSRSAK